MTYKSYKRQLKRIYNASMRFVGSYNDEDKDYISSHQIKPFKNKCISGKSIKRLLKNPSTIQYLKTQSIFLDNELKSIIDNIENSKRYVLLTCYDPHTGNEFIYDIMR